MPEVEQDQTDVEETATSWKPRRHLPADLAEAIRDAKLASRLSWRELSRRSGVSHPHLCLISRGRRVPSREVARRIINALGLDGDTARWLLDEAVEREAAPPGRPRGRVVR
jgi:transcriptional regulator with XRE-family HTH domain